MELSNKSANWQANLFETHKPGILAEKVPLDFPLHLYHSKQAQVMFTYDLARRLRGSGVTVNCVRVTNVAIPDERLTHLPGWVRQVYKLKRGMSITPERQAQTYVYLAADPAVQDVTGGYWDENNRQVRSNAKSYDQETWKKLWDVSASLAGV